MLRQPIVIRADSSRARGLGQRVSAGGGRPPRHRLCLWNKQMMVRRWPLRTCDLAYYLCHATTGVGPPTLVRLAVTRWRIERTFQPGRGCTGLDEHQVRTWTSSQRHPGHAHPGFLAVTAAHYQPASAEPFTDHDM